jgi:hypothetical protein
MILSITVVSVIILQESLLLSKKSLKDYLVQTESTYLDHDVIVSEQFGFRSQSSTAKASYLLFNEILVAINKQ